MYRFIYPVTSFRFEIKNSRRNSCKILSQLNLRNSTWFISYQYSWFLNFLQIYYKKNRDNKEITLFFCLSLKGWVMWKFLIVFTLFSSVLAITDYCDPILCPSYQFSNHTGFLLFPFTLKIDFWQFFFQHLACKNRGVSLKEPKSS